MKLLTWNCRLVSGCIAIVALGAVSAVSAQSETPPASPPAQVMQQHPELGGHIFMSSTRLLDPFVRTTFRSALGVGIASDYETAAPIIGDTPILSTAGDLLYTNLGFQYQQRIKPWIAMFIQADLQGRLGTGLQAALVEGVRASMTGEVGWLLRVKETERFYLSTALSVSNNSTTAMDPLGFVQGVINDDEVTDDNRLVRTTPALLANVGLRGAWEWSKTVGVVGFFQVSAGDSYDPEARDAVYTNSAIGLDTELHRWLHAPLSLLTAYGFANEPEGGDQFKPAINTLLVQLGYLAPGGFAISLDVANQWMDKRQTSQPLHVLWPALTMKYYF